MERGSFGTGLERRDGIGQRWEPEVSPKTNAEEGGGPEEAQSPYHHGHLTRMRHVIVYRPLSTTLAASARASSTRCPAVTGAS